MPLSGSKQSFFSALQNSDKIMCIQGHWLSENTFETLKYQAIKEMTSV
jgi:hypothetical protein